MRKWIISLNIQSTAVRSILRPKKPTLNLSSRWHIQMLMKPLLYSIFERPKSDNIILASSSGLMYSRFSGFRSRCTMPNECRYCTAWNMSQRLFFESWIFLKYSIIIWNRWKSKCFTTEWRRMRLFNFEDFRSKFFRITAFMVSSFI